MTLVRKGANRLTHVRRQRHTGYLMRGYPVLQLQGSLVHHEESLGRHCQQDGYELVGEEILWGSFVDHSSMLDCLLEKYNM